MAKVKLDLQGTSVPEKIRKAREIVVQLTGNAHFPQAGPLVAELTASVGALESDYDAAQVARQVATAKTAAQVATERGFDGVLTRVASHVEDASHGDVAQIKSAGLEIRADSRPVGTLPAPHGLTVTVGDADGALDIHWDPVKGAVSYSIESTEDAAQSPWSDPVAKVAP